MKNKESEKLNQKNEKPTHGPKSDDERKESTVKDGSNNKNLWFSIAAIALVVIASALLFVYGNNYYNDKYSELKNQNQDLNQKLEYRDSLVNEWVNTFNEIENDLITMQEKEDLLKINSTDPELTKDVRERVISEIKQLNSMLKDNKAKIASLNRKLRNSGMEIASLKEKVIKLENAVEKRDRSIADLKFELIENDFKLKDLNMTLDSLDQEILRKTHEIQWHKTQLNRAYYALGNTKELKEKGLLEKEGGFLGLLGKSKTVSTSLSVEKFHPININNTNKIAINAKKAEIISDHPSNSYEFVSNDSLIAYIEIKNPEEFWKITKYAVVETNR